MFPHVKPVLSLGARATVRRLEINLWTSDTLLHLEAYTRGCLVRATASLLGTPDWHHLSRRPRRRPPDKPNRQLFFLRTTVRTDFYWLASTYGTFPTRCDRTAALRVFLLSEDAVINPGQFYERCSSYSLSQPISGLFQNFPWLSDSLHVALVNVMPCFHQMDDIGRCFTPCHRLWYSMRYVFDCPCCPDPPISAQRRPLTTWV